MIIPSIDLMNGKAVQLIQGKKKIIEKENVLELAKEFSKYGEIAVIDLDAALEKGNNTELIKKICKMYDCRVGGGIRTIEKANKILSFGAKKIIIGTCASKKFLSQLPKERLIVAIDSKNNNVVNKGWKQTTSKTYIEMITELEDYCSEFLFTDVNNEGMMKGLNINIAKELKSLTRNKITFAGSISSTEDICYLDRLDMNSQIGMALYTEKINLNEAVINILDFKKNNGVMPTIIQDESSQVLMLAYSNAESLKKTFQSNVACYYSRSRKKLWTKGETSGNYQNFIKARYDCDNDTLLFTVKQNNFACHKGNYSCFGNKKFNIQELYDVIVDRMNNLEKKSYTSQLMMDEQKIIEKIKEESQEVVNYKDEENLIWEISDLTYFITALMVKKGITIQQINNELWRRRK
jgi:phosphoribosyl-AMP cyclohydrolase / phosphoribosyl-ATP pyrophosphohydrolase